MDKQGLLMCSRYAASPNFFGYCGPNKSSNIIDHLKEKIADEELAHLLVEFETLYPYLQLIAKENKIRDPFDKGVVEAYWLGNSLLNNIKNRDYLDFFKEKLFLDKKINNQGFKKIASKILTLDYLPHHNFHVFNIFKRTGKDSSSHTLKTMDECRINCGKILKSNGKVFVEAEPLVLFKGKLSLGQPTLKEVISNFKGKQFLEDLRKGEWVSFHWGIICDILTERQIKNLEFYTQKAIDFYNQ